MRESDPIGGGGGSKAISAIFLAILSLTIVISPVLASDGETTIPSFDEALIYASGIDISVIVGFVVSVLLDWWPAYSDLTTAQKRAVYVLFCLGVPVGAATLRGVLGYAPWSFDPLLWHAIWCGVAAAIAGTLVHVKVRKNAR